MSDYVDVREIHPDCVELPCRYEACDNTEWICGAGSARGYTVCDDCFGGPDVEHLFPKVTVRL